MLVLERRLGQRIFIGDDIVITVVDIREEGTKVRIGIDAPASLIVDREEIAGRRAEAKRRKRGGRVGDETTAVE